VRKLITVSSCSTPARTRTVFTLTTPRVSYSQVSALLRPNSITLSSSLAGRRPASEPVREQIPLHYLARDLARELVGELVCDLLWLNFIMLSRSKTWSQTWFPTCRRQVRAISTSRDSSNLVADRFRPYSITLSSLQPAPARDLVASWTV